MDSFKTDNLFAADLPEVSSGTWVRFHYADMADMPTWSAPPRTAWDDSAWDNENNRRGGGISNAITLARQGWPEGAEQARALHAGIQASVPVRAKLARHDVAGEFPVIARALAGNPLYMRRMVRKETAQRPIVLLVCDICVSWNFPASGMLAHAAAVAAVVDFLEDAGFRCNVIVVARATCSKVSSEIAVQLKAPEQPLNLATLAYGMGHPSFFRRLMFATWYADADCKPLGTALGVVKSIPAAPELGTYTIGAASKAGDNATAQARFRHILRELDRQGCPGIPEDMRDAA